MKIFSEKLVNRQIAREYKKLLKISYQTLNNDDKNLIRRALDLAIDAHKDQYRKSGEPYVFHPISVAKIVAEKIGLDANSIAAALLHGCSSASSLRLRLRLRLRLTCCTGALACCAALALTALAHRFQDGAQAIF